MAVRDDGLYYPTENIISKKARRHYRTPVRSQHWQLRSLISAAKRNTVYFPGGHGSNHVQRLDTLTHECETIKLLTFAPRCLVARQGWLCCGSENGEFVAMRLDDGGHSDNLDVPSDIDPDARLPFGIVSQTEESLNNMLTRARRSNKSMIAKNVKLAKERVNCITLWFPSPQVPLYRLAYDSPVAVLANNDRTVTLVNLYGFEDREKVEPLDVINYPDFVNRSIISPDGRILVSILDDPYLYIHERVDTSLEENATQSREGLQRGWKQRQRILLKSQRKDDRSDSRGSFAACFSSSGAYLAIGTQHGTISIFNAAMLLDPDANPVITTFQSSRPESGPGAIRDMAFCPGPYDILAWTEDRGHVGIADMRSNFAVRQIVDINVEADFEHINVFDRNTVDPRLLERRGERRDTPARVAPGSHGNISISDTRYRAFENHDALNYPLSANEMMVLEAMQGSRRQRDRANLRAAAAAASGTGAGGGTRAEETPPSRLANTSREAPASLRPPGADAEFRRTRERSNSVGRAIGDLLGNYREQRAGVEVRPRITMQRFRDESTAAAVAAAGAETQATNAARRPERWTDRLGETVAAIRDQRERQDSSYLSVLEILQARERETSDPETGDTGLLVPLVNQVVSRWEESAIRGTLAPDHGVFEVPPSPDNTAGLAWSDDGRTLFIGAQNGIYEFQVNVQNRKLCPSIDPR